MYAYAKNEGYMLKKYKLKKIIQKYAVKESEYIYYFAFINY